MDIGGYDGGVSEPGGGGDRGTPRLGSMFGRYRIESVVGRGGMGVVVRATDTELGRIVALKFLAPELRDDPRMRERFLREPRLAAAIEHPNIVPIHEAGELDGTPYIAMRAIPGNDLATILRREAPLAVDRASAILVQLADALDAAHRRGLVHRDVKPGNVLIEPGEDGTPERAWLTDFGLTRRAGDGVTVTAAAPAGTLDYLAPELIAGGPVGPWTDQYALACLAFECLTGSPPWDGPTDAAVLHGHIGGDRTALMGRLPQPSPPAAGALVRALAVDPDRRFRDCRQFAAAFAGQVPSTDPAASATPSSTTRLDATAARPVRTRSGRQVLAVVLAIGAILMGAGALAAINGGADPPPSFVPAASPTAPAASPSAPAASPSAPAPSPWLMGGDAEGVIVFAGGRPGELDLYAIRPDGSGLRRLTSEPGDERFPSVSTDGRWIVYTAGAVGSRDLWRIHPDGSGRERLTRDRGDDYAGALSPDGRRLLWTSEREGWADIFLMDDTGDGFREATATNLTLVPGEDGNHHDSFPAWSPDGRWFAFASNRFESADIWRMDPDRPSGVRWLTLDDVLWADMAPTVDPDGSVVFVGQRGHYDRELYRVTSPRKPPERLTTLSQSITQPDVAPDGERMVASEGVVRDIQAPGRTRLVVLGTDGSVIRRLDLGLRTAMDADWTVQLVSGVSDDTEPTPSPGALPTTEPS
jgi:serine/threonine-protein kinase